MENVMFYHIINKDKNMNSNNNTLEILAAKKDGQGYYYYFISLTFDNEMTLKVDTVNNVRLLMESNLELENLDSKSVLEIYRLILYKINENKKIYNNNDNVSLIKDVFNKTKTFEINKSDIEEIKDCVSKRLGR